MLSFFLLLSFLFRQYQLRQSRVCIESKKDAIRRLTFDFIPLIRAVSEGLDMKTSEASVSYSLKCHLSYRVAMGMNDPTRSRLWEIHPNPIWLTLTRGFLRITPVLSPCSAHAMFTILFRGLRAIAGMAKCGAYRSFQRSWSLI